MRGTSKLFRRFLSLIGPKMLTTLIAVLSTPIIVRLLGPGDYGNYAVLLSIYSLYMIPISSAITQGVQKFVSEDRAEDAWVERVVQFYLALAVVLALAGGALLVVFTGLGYAENLGENFTLYFYALVGFIVAGQFRGLSMHTVLGFGLEHVKGPLEVVKKTLTVLLGIALVISGLSVVGMLIGHIVANTIVAVIGGYVILRQISVRQLFRLPDSLPYREFLSFNVLNVVLVLLVMSLFHVDVIMVRTLVGDEATGFYKAALALAEYIWIVPIVLQSLLLHSTSTLWSEGRQAQITELAGRITRYTTLLVVLMAIGLATLADRFVPIYYGQEFMVSTGPLLLLLPGAVGFAVARPLQAICQGSGEMKTLIVATGIAATLNVALNSLLIPMFGMNGAAAATSIAYGSMFVLLVWAAWQIGYDPLVDFRSERLGITVVTTGVSIIAVDAVLQSDLLALVLVPIIGVSIYTVVAIGIGALDRGEIIEILEQLPLPFDVGRLSSS